MRAFLLEAEAAAAAAAAEVYNSHIISMFVS